jgi:uncharacterized membrane protein
MAKKLVLEDQIEIAASPTVLWTYLTNLEHWPDWFPSLTEAEWVHGTPWTAGAKFHRTIGWGFPLGDVTGEVTITEITPSSFVAWEGQVGMMNALHSFCLNGTVAGSEVTVRHELQSSLMSLARILFLPRCMRNKYQAALEGLKMYVETGKV